MMKIGVLCAALLLITLSASARKDSGRDDNVGNQSSDRERAAESRDHKTAPTPTAVIIQPKAVPVATAAPQPAITGKQKNGKNDNDPAPRPVKTPKVEKQHEDKADRPEKRGKQEKNRNKKNDDEPSTGKQQGEWNDPPAEGVPVENMPDENSDEASPSDTPAMPVVPGVGTGNVQTHTDEESDAEPISGRGSRRQGRRNEPTPAAEQATPFVPTGTPPSDPGVAMTPEPIVAPRPVRTPAKTPKPPKAKKQKPRPTPGPTPVPTPATATPTPADFRPPNNWQPPPGWLPPPGWKPPENWRPSGGWLAPPGWKPPKGWVLRLYKWGWTWVPKRGWFIPPAWVPPPSFVCPPGWYHMPRDCYNTYDVFDPVEIVVSPGIARPDLVQQIITTEPYTPSDEVAEEIYDEELEGETEEDGMERPLPDEPPELARTSDVDELVRMLTRGRDPVLRYAGPVYATQRIQFEDDGYAILPQSFETLDMIGAALLESELESAIISIEAHLNDSLDDAEARVLTRRRAWAVKGYLVQKFGIDPERLVYIGYGNDAPIAPHNTDDGLAMNERVEIENVTDLFVVEGAGKEESVEDTDDKTSVSMEDAATTASELSTSATLDSRSTGTLLLPLKSTIAPIETGDSGTSHTKDSETFTTESSALKSPAQVSQFIFGGPALLHAIRTGHLLTY